MLKYLPLITAIIVIGFTTLVSMPESPYLINGQTQAAISDKYSTPITPAGFTFSIWSLIYLSWIIIGGMIAFSKIKVSSKVMASFSLAMVITAIWLIPWGYDMIGIALIIMLILLGLLWYIFSLVRSEKGILRNTIELFMGWIHIATFANFAVWLQYMGFIGSGIERIYWGIAILTVAFLATLFFQIRYRTYIVTLVYLWASLGMYFAQPKTLLTILLIIYAVMTGALTIMSYAKKR